MGQRNLKRGVRWMLGVTLALLTTLALAFKPAELIEGPAGLSAYQDPGIIWSRIVITYNGETILKKRLSTRYRGGSWKTEFQGQPVKVRCQTFNGFSLAVDCKMYGARQIAQITIPYGKPGQLVSGLEGLGAERIEHAFRDEIVVRYKGADLTNGSLWLRDGVGRWRGKIEGQPVRVRCATVNDFMKIVDCRVFTTGEDALIAHLRVPLY